MEKSVRAVLTAVAGLVSFGCQQTPPLPDAPAESTNMAEKPLGYTALPGQAATSSTPSETTTAFEFAAASLDAQSSSSPGAPAPFSSGEPSPAASVSRPPLPVSLPASAPAAPPIPDPRPVPDSEEVLPSPRQVSSPSPATSGGSATISAGEPVNKVSADPGGYAVQVTNGTSGRLFIEMQDDSGNIFPFGFMYAGQRIASRPQDPRPIKGQLTVIIRDPDQPSAPELRRYHVVPPDNYAGHTLGITILPGGRYRAAVDGKVYFTSPEPATPQQ